MPNPVLLSLKVTQSKDQASSEMAALNAVRRFELVPLIAGEEGGTRGVAVKCIDITKNPDCEGILPAR